MFARPTDQSCIPDDIHDEPLHAGGAEGHTPSAEVLHQYLDRSSGGAGGPVRGGGIEHDGAKGLQGQRMVPASETHRARFEKVGTERWGEEAASHRIRPTTMATWNALLLTMRTTARDRDHPGSLVFPSAPPSLGSRGFTTLNKTIPATMLPRNNSALVPPEPADTMPGPGQ